MQTLDAVLGEDRAARENERRVRIASAVALGLLCPAALWCAAHGVTPLVRGAYALMGAGTAIAVCATWSYLIWSRQSRPGSADSRSQLQTTVLLLSRQANLLKAEALWCAPIFLSVVLIGMWIYQERSHAEAYLLWVITSAGWLVTSIGGFAKSRTLDERRSRMERILSDLQA